MQAVEELETRFRRIAALGEAAGILHWDMSVMMPAGSAGGRAEQLAALRLVEHGMESDPAVGELLDRAEDGGDAWRRANLAEMRRRWLHATAVEPGLVEAETRAGLACEMAWREARPAGDFARVRPFLAEALELTRARAQAVAEALGCTPYEALADAHEPGARTARSDALFDALAGFLPDFLERARSVRAGRAPLALEIGRAHV